MNRNNLVKEMLADLYCFYLDKHLSIEEFRSLYLCNFRKMTELRNLERKSTENMVKRNRDDDDQRIYKGLYHTYYLE